MNKPKNVFLLFLLCLVSTENLGQSSVWLGVRTKSHLAKNWQLATFTETRYRLNAIRPERAFVEAGPVRKAKKYISVATPVRFTAFDNQENRRHEVRLGLQGILRLDVNKGLKFKYRSFYQWDKSLGQGDFQKSYWRHKFDFAKKWNTKWGSQIEQEFWHDFTATGKVDRYRLVLSNVLSVKGNSKIYLGYLMQTPIFTGFTYLEKIGVVRLQTQI